MIKNNKEIWLKVYTQVKPYYLGVPEFALQRIVSDQGFPMDIRQWTREADRPISMVQIRDHIGHHMLGPR